MELVWREKARSQVVFSDQRQPHAATVHPSLHTISSYYGSIKDQSPFLPFIRRRLDNKSPTHPPPQFFKAYRLRGTGKILVFRTSNSIKKQELCLSPLLFSQMKSLSIQYAGSTISGYPLNLALL